MREFTAAATRGPSRCVPYRDTRRSRSRARSSRECPQRARDPATTDITASEQSFSIEVYCGACDRGHSRCVPYHDYAAVDLRPHQP